MSERSQWQPIEMAPRDGTRVLLCDKAHPLAEPWIASRKNGQCVRGQPTGWDWHTPDVAIYPTHWQPLPEIPRCPPALSALDARSIPTRLLNIVRLRSTAAAIRSRRTNTCAARKARTTAKTATSPARAAISRWASRRRRKDGSRHDH